MRVALQNDPSAAEFSRQLLSLGNGHIPIDVLTGLISFPANFCEFTSSKEELITKVFPNIDVNYNNHDWMSERAILAERNKDVDSLNFTIQMGSIIIMLRNLNPPKLCNGTRLSVKKLMNNVIQSTIIKGNFKGEEVLIPRIPIIPRDLPFQFKRIQFPLYVASSRVGKPSSLFIFAPENKTKNIVYQNALY
ncbi:unnamed protein product [Macrosiphum euphorbiae]|uniref:DNA helicase Pif1-like 2B domain-containing protein n=1 Tax=Macrosiphum euphorbiae TaxID=13131 RepID=A0AAV0WTI8_9HEMI|nr:unnamed protein product [Macrosiphum euphorbiae]